MKQVLTGIWHFYRDGFRGMTWGRTLWVIILVKLFIMFFVLRLFFFPRFLDTSAAGPDKDEYVSGELVRRGIGTDVAPSSPSSSSFAGEEGRAEGSAIE
ncbi:MAG: DUF4492 domain-containing protein [Bacteroides sp.]|nr:DUF4492 domain-containing protein [Bacteroides sp.]